MPEHLVPWGKLDGDKRPSLSLVGHSLDVAAVFEALLEVPAMRRALARAGGQDDLSPVQIARLTWLVACHDLGKLNTGFQARGHRALKAVWRGHRDEALALLGLYKEPRTTLVPAVRTALRLDDVMAWSDPPGLGLLVAAWAHHGRLARGSETNVAAAWRAVKGYDPADALRGFAAAIQPLFAEAFAGGAGQALPATPLFQHVFLGLVELADWLGSDPARFPPDAPRAGAERWPASRGWARDALAALRFTGAAPRPQAPPVRDITAVADVRPGSVTSPVQAAMARLGSEAPAEGGLAILESETGSGKTEAALLYFAELHRRGRVQGLYFALPTRTSAVQLHGRVSKAMRSLFGAEAPPVLLAVPGYVRVDDVEGMRLPGFEVQWHEEKEPPGAWAAAHPKRYMAAPVLVGTVDQVLMGSLRVPHAHMRFAPLARLLLVVDEVHASDPYMAALLRGVLDRHRALGGHSLLMSATLAASAWACHAGREVPPTPEEAAQAPYPRITASWRRDLPQPAPAAREKEVAVTLRPIMDDATAIATAALEAARAGQTVLVVRNRVDDAVAVQRAVEVAAALETHLLFRVGGVTTLHHGRFAAADREALDAALEGALGKHAPRPHGRVVVGTQTLEQSLDIDADLLITDLCPMDVLLQRIGRLWRHGWRARPVDVARVHVLTPAGATDRSGIRAALTPFLTRAAFGLGGHVYSDLRVLAATWAALLGTEVLRLPADNRRLVEAALHPRVLDAVMRDGGEAWARHGGDMAAIALAQTGQAHQALLNDAASFDQPNRWFEIVADLDERLATRLGAEDRMIALAPPLPSPLDAERTITEIKVPAWMAQGVPADAVGRTAPGGGITLARAGRPALSLVYDRLGLRFSATPEI